MGARDAFYYGAFLFAVHREVSAQDMPLLVPINHHLVFMLGHDGLLVVCVAGICPYHRRTVGQLVLVAPMEHAVVGSHGAVRLAQTVKPAPRDADVPSKPSFTSVCGVGRFASPLPFVPFWDLRPKQSLRPAFTSLCSSAIFLSFSPSCLSSPDIWTAIADVASLLLRSSSVSSDILSVSSDMRLSLSLRAASDSSMRSRW